MKLVKVIETNDIDKFQMYCDNLISQGFTLSSSSCGFVNDSKYDYCSCYQAIFTRNIADIKPMQGSYITECCKDGCEYFNNIKGCTFKGETYVKKEKENSDKWIETCIKGDGAITMAQYKNITKV